MGCGLRLTVIALALASPVVGKRTTGGVALGPRQAKVVTKFCFDFKKGCAANDHNNCPRDSQPGMLNISVFSATVSGGSGASLGDVPDVHVSLLDDEYFSFPEVSQVW